MNSRNFKAFLIAPLIPVVVACVSIPLTMSYFWSFVIIFLSALSSYSGTLIFGIPTLKLLKTHGYLNLMTLSLAGTFWGIIVFYLATSLIFGTYNEFNIITVLYGAVLGFFVSITYGLIAGITSHLKGNT